MLTGKISEKNTLQGLGGNTYSKNSKYKKEFFFVLPMYKKGLDIKMTNITMKSYLKCETDVIDKGRSFWINRKDLEIESDAN